MLPFRRFASTRHPVPRLTGIGWPDSEVRRSVIQAIKTFPNGATTKDIFDAALPKAAVADASGSTASTSAAPEHPYKSIRHLKKYILAMMQKNDMIQKIHVPLDPEAAASRAEAMVAPSRQKRKMQARKAAWFWTVQEENVPRSFLTTSSSSPPDTSTPPAASQDRQHGT